jgi:hypothetical protein
MNNLYAINSEQDEWSYIRPNQNEWIKSEAKLTIFG